MAILNNNPLVGASGNQGGYNINNSLRLRSSASAYLNRTPASTTNRRTFTYSFWYKRGDMSTSVHFLWANNASTFQTSISLSSDSGPASNISITLGNGSAKYQTTTTAVFRDPSAWYHIVIAVDTTQATSSNRLKIYVNGEQQTAFSNVNYPPQNFDTWINSNSVTHYIGASYYNGSYTYTNGEGYLAEVNFIDGLQKAASDFGETDTTTGVWKPKAYTGTYGTNGFYLKFSDIATTSGSNAGLGKDFSGNSNYWTTNNISVTSGTTYDAMTDSPTNTSATVANYCVLNPLKINGSAGTFSNGNLNVIVAGDSSNSGTIAFSSGKIYFEVQLTAATESTAIIGIADSNFAQASFTNAGAINYGYLGTGVKGSNGSYVSYGATYTVNDIIGVAADLDAGTLVFYKNGVSQGTAYTSISGTFIPAVGNGNSGTTKTYVANFGQRPFAYTPPTGYVALNTFNLPTSTIVKGSSYMQALLYTGNGTNNRTVTGVGFNPSLTWVKSRSLANSHVLADSVRGTNANIYSNLTNAETAPASSGGGGIGQVTTDGFTLVQGTVGFDNSNGNGATYVAWNWLAGTSTSSNTSGSITSTVSVNTTAGFSIVNWTANNSTATIGHGLGVAPKMIITKDRNDASNWDVYHVSLGATKYLQLNTTIAAGTSSTRWNNTEPTSTVFSVSTDVNYLTHSIIAYCWAEIAGFSRFTSYTGNGSADGPFVYLGFRPKWLLIKQTDVSRNWILVDSSRNTFNIVNLPLLPNDAGAEYTSTTTVFDFVSNGFKIRSNHVEANGSGNTYIVAAFAENPFKNSLAR